MTSRQDIIAYLYSTPSHRLSDPEGRLNSVLRDAVAYQGSPRGMSQLLAALESEGMIKRTINGRRCFVIDLTNQGAQDAKSLPAYTPNAPRTEVSEGTPVTASSAGTEKAAAKKSPAKKTAAKKSPAKKSAAKKATAKKAPAKKAPAVAKATTPGDADAAAKAAALKASAAKGLATKAAKAAAVKGASAQVKAAAKAAAQKASAAKSLATKAANAAERAKGSSDATAPTAVVKSSNFTPGSSNLKKLPAVVDSLARTLLDVTLERYTHLEELEQDVIDAQKERDEALRIAENLRGEIVALKAQSALLQNNLDAVLQGPDKSVDIAIRSKRLALLLGGR